MYSRKAGRWSGAMPSCSPMTTVPPPATPVVIVVCAWAAIGAAMAPAIAAMANSLFRMVNSFARRGADLRQHTHAGPIHRVRHCSGKTAASYAAFLGKCCGGWNPLESWASCYSQTAQAVKLRPSIRFPSFAGDFNDHHRCAHFPDRRPDCGSLDSDYAAVPEFHRRHLLDRRRFGRPRRVQDVSVLARESSLSRL